MAELQKNETAADADESKRKRLVAESFGSEAKRYDQSRPSYPQVLIESIIAAVPGSMILDVGCGTGIASKQFQASGCTVLGVEPDMRMAAIAKAEGIEVDVATFENWNQAGRTFDAVVSAQAWHWVDPVVGANKAACALKPNGLLAVFWNTGQPDAQINEAFKLSYERIKYSSRRNPWKQPAMIGHRSEFTRGVTVANKFTAVTERNFTWSKFYARDEWLEQVTTFRSSGKLPPDVLRKLLGYIGAAIDANGGGFQMNYRTVVMAARRTE